MRTNRCQTTQFSSKFGEGKKSVELLAPGERKPRSLSGPEGLEPVREVRQTYPQPPVP